MAYRRPILFDPPERPVEVDAWVPGDRVDAARAWFESVDVVESTPARVLLRLRGATLPLVIRRLFAFGEGWEVVSPPEARVEVRRWCEIALESRSG